MTPDLALALVAPAVGAAMTLVAAPAPRARTAVSRLAALAGVGGACWILVRALAGPAPVWAAFEADVWRALVAASASAVCAAGVIAARATDDAASATDDAARASAALAAQGAAVAGALAVDGAVFAICFLLTSFALLIAGAAVADREPMRAAAVLAGGDLLAISALALASSEGTRVPFTHLSGVAAAAAVAALILKSGLVAPRAIARTAERNPVAAALLWGPPRAQAILLGSWLARGEGDFRVLTVLVAAAAAAYWARRSAREGSAHAALTAGTALSILAVLLGSVAGGAGAALLVAGVAAGSVLSVLGAAPALGFTVGAAPLGAVLPGAAVVAAAVTERAIVELEIVPIAMLCLGAALWLALAGVAGVTTRDAPRASARWAVLPGLAAIAAGLAPGRTLDALALPATRAMGFGEPLADLAGAFSDDVGLVFAVAGVAGVVAALPAARAAAVDAPAPAELSAGDGAVHTVTLVLFAIATCAAAVLLWVGVRHGFL